MHVVGVGVALAVAVALSAQTRWPSPWHFTYKGGTTRLDNHADFQVEKRFIVGWHWGMVPHASKAVKARQLHLTLYANGTLNEIWVGPQAAWCADSARLIMNLYPFQGSPGTSYPNNIGMMWEPTYLVDTINPYGSFRPRSDTLGYAFGFAHVRGWRPMSPSDPNYDRLVLLPAQFSPDSDALVLARPWLDNMLGRTTDRFLPQDTNAREYWDGYDTLSRGDQQWMTQDTTLPAYRTQRRDHYGVRFFLLLNLRRIGGSDTASSDEPVLRVRVPYAMWARPDGTRQTGYVRFSQVPSRAPDSTYWLPPIHGTGRSRGLVRMMRSVSPSVTEFAITRSMLPRGDSAEPDITIMAEMVFDGDTLYRSLPYHNPILKYHKNMYEPVRAVDSLDRASLIGYGDTTMIDRLGLEVWYRPSAQCTVGIDWVAMVTPETWKILAGYYDSIMIVRMQRACTGLSDSIYTRKGLRPYRFYAADEGSASTWLVRWYLSRLLGYIFTAEDGAMTPQFKHYLKPREYWTPMPSAIGYAAWFPKPDSCRGGCDTCNDWRRYFCCYPEFVTDFSVVPVRCQQAVLDYQRKRVYMGEGYDLDYILADLSATERRKRLLDAHYETAIFKQTPADTFNLFSDAKLNPYVQYPEHGRSHAVGVERMDYAYLYSEILPWHSPHFLFDTVPWWGQLWFDPYFYYHEAFPNSGDTTRLLRLAPSDARMRVGEELRSHLWRIVLYGAKGMIFDGPEDESQIPGVLKPGENTYFVTTRLMTSHHFWRKHTTDSAQFMDIVKRLGSQQLRDTILFGGDFLDTTQSPHDRIITRYLNLTETTKLLHLPPHRFYVGRRSMRREVGRIADWAYGVEDTLWKLRLQAAMMKGYRKFAVSRVGFGVGDLWKFIDTSGLRVRKIGAKTYENDGGYYKDSLNPTSWVGVDSSFYHVVLHYEEGRSPDTLFYLGVLNSRTSPHVPADSVRDPRTRQPYRLGDWDTGVVRFYSTYEFDTLVAGGYVDRYAQLGAREITIPFHVRPTKDYACRLHVRELGGGVDTVIGGSQPLAVKFLPGEGKLFRVQVLYDSPPLGELAHSNQRKLVGVPVDAKGQVMVYHLVYHRRVLDTACGCERRKVFYRRSYPVWVGGGMTANIAWEAERVLSDRLVVAPDSLQYSHFGDSTGFWHLSRCADCGYPSLVVRPIGDQQYVYVVFGCRMPDATSNLDVVVIAETVFPATGQQEVLAAVVLDGYRVQPSSDSTLGHWGTPVVNASWEGNYYSWPNRVENHLLVGFKPPGNRYLRVVSWARANQAGVPLHPSLNTYSRLGQRERDCALVWEQNGQIYYTRLRADTASGEFYDSPPLYALQAPICISQDNREVCADSNRFPVVYRGVEDFGNIESARVELMRRAQDRIAWEGLWRMSDNPNRRRRIFYRMLNLIDEFPGGDTLQRKQPREYELYPLSTFVSLGNNLLQPNLAQGRAWVDNRRGSMWRNLSDSAVVLGFTQAPTQATNRCWLWHVPLHLWMQPDETTIPISRRRRLEVVGQLGHLSAIPGIGTGTRLHQTRRVQQTGDTTSRIVTTSQFLWRSTPAEVTALGYYGAEDEITQAVTAMPGPPPHCTRYDVIIAPPCIPCLDLEIEPAPPLRIESLDTARTQWFTVIDTLDIGLLVLGSDTSKVRMEIVRASDGLRRTVPLSPAPDTAGLLLERVLVNGGGDQYRLELIVGGGALTETYYVGPIPVVNDTAPDRRILGRNSVPSYERLVIDLGHRAEGGSFSLDAYPIPADEHVSVRIWSSEGRWYRVRLYTVVGVAVAEGSCRAGQELTFSTLTMPPGVYIVRADDGSGNVVQRLVVVQR